MGIERRKRVKRIVVPVMRKKGLRGVKADPKNEETEEKNPKKKT